MIKLHAPHIDAAIENAMENAASYALESALQGAAAKATSAIKQVMEAGKARAHEIGNNARRVSRETFSLPEDHQILSSEDNLSGPPDAERWPGKGHSSSPADQQSR